MEATVESKENSFKDLIFNDVNVNFRIKAEVYKKEVDRARSEGTIKEKTKADRERLVTEIQELIKQMNH